MSLRDQFNSVRRHSAVHGHCQEVHSFLVNNFTSDVRQNDCAENVIFFVKFQSFFFRQISNIFTQLDYYYMKTFSLEKF